MSGKPSRFGWNELMTTDPEGAKKFYAQVFGWGSRDMALSDPTQPAEEDEPAYTLWTVEGGEAGGMMKMEGDEYENVPPHWLSYVSVENVDQTAEAVRQAGGRIVAGPLDIKDIGRFYIIADPQGAVLGIGTSTMKK